MGKVRAGATDAGASISKEWSWRKMHSVQLLTASTANCWREEVSPAPMFGDRGECRMRLLSLQGTTLWSQAVMVLQYSAGPLNKRPASNTLVWAKALACPWQQHVGHAGLTQQMPGVAPMCWHGSQRLTCIKSLKGITALESRCPSRPLSAGACPRSGSRRGKGLHWNPRGGPVCASSPPRQGWGPRKPRKDDGQWAVSSSGRPLRPSPAGLEHPARGWGDAVRSGNVPEPPCAAGDRESPRCGRNPARNSEATEKVPHSGESQARSARTDETAQQRTRTRGRTLARRPGWNGRHGKFQLVRES